MALVQEQTNPDLTKLSDSLTEIFFHNCCRGGQRKNGTRWKSTPTAFHSLTAICQNDHEHLPYQTHADNGTWSFDTSSEAAYPELLTQRVPSAVRKFLESKNISFQPLPLPRIHTLAVQHRQHKKRSQLIPEFADIHWLPANTVIHDSQKKFMTEGVPLVGSHDHPSCYPLKLKAASMSEEELRDSALSCPGEKEASNRSPGLCRTSRGNSCRRGETAISRRAFLLFSRSE